MEDLESSSHVFTEVRLLNNEVTPSIPNFRDVPKNFQNCEKRNECRQDIPLNIPKKADECIIHEEEQTHCDFVMGDRVVDIDSKWKTFSSEDKAQVGVNNLSTIINPVSLDAFSKPLNNNTMSVRSTGKKYLRNEQKNSIINAFRTISSMADRINVTKIIADRANKLFKAVREGKKLNGYSLDAIAGACMYIACRQEGMPRTFKEIVAVSTVSKKEIIKCFKLILKVHDTHVDLITTADFMSRFCETLSLAKDVEKAADFIAKKATDLDIVLGRSPRSVAAASIYMASQASGDKKTLCDIADIASVHFMTIRRCYQLMRPRATEIFPSDFKFERRIEYLPRT